MEHFTDSDWTKIEEAARKAGVPYFTRRKWKERKSVPPRHWLHLIEASEGEITRDTFLPSHPPAQEAAE